MENKKVISEFNKNDSEKIKVELGEFHGRGMVSVRVYYNANEANQEWIPTRKGITMSSDLIPKLKDAIDEAHYVWQGQTN